jgi:hypothetical protein
MVFGCCLWRGRATRTCSVPEGTALFFPVNNSVNIDTPGRVGSSKVFRSSNCAPSLLAPLMRHLNLSVQLDGVPIKKVRRVKSKVFAVALPEDNVFDALCGSNNVPAGIYSPAVDDGFYVLLDKLSAGKHTLKFQAKDSKDKPVQNVTYYLTVVPVSTK